MTLLRKELCQKIKSQKYLKSLKKASAWAHAKEVGKPFVPSGQATQAYERMIVNLKSKGVHVVEVGELESFDKSVGN